MPAVLPTTSHVHLLGSAFPGKPASAGLPRVAMRRRRLHFWNVRGAHQQARAASNRNPPQLMIVDEAHHLLAGSVREQRQSVNQLKFLSNKLRTPVVALGTSEALYAMQADPQIASRFEPFALPSWH